MRAAVIIFLGPGLPLLLGFAGWCGWAWMGLGAAAWAGALIVKVAVGIGVDAAARRAFRSPRARAAVWGLWSGIAELGAAAAVFLAAEPCPALQDALGFGVGAGSIEVAFVVITGAAAFGRGVPPAGDRPPGLVLLWGGVIERGLTSVGHLTTRGLVWASVWDPAFWPGVLLSLGTFTLVDGVATLGETEGWNWEDARILRRFYVFLSAVTAVELLAFGIVLWLLQSP